MPTGKAGIAWEIRLSLNRTMKEAPNLYTSRIALLTEPRASGCIHPFHLQSKRQIKQVAKVAEKAAGAGENVCFVYGHVDSRGLAEKARTPCTLNGK